MSRVVAYCPPGTDVLADLVLALRGEHVDEIIEHELLAGGRDILVVTDPGPLEIPGGAASPRC